MTIIPFKRENQMKEIITTDKAPSAIGPYSQAVKVPEGKLLFCSGQIPLDPETMEIVGTSAAEQCSQVMENINQLLKAAGANFENVIKTTIYLTDMNDFASINEVYGRSFKQNPPARACVEVSRLPKDVKIEIEVVAVL